MKSTIFTTTLATLLLHTSTSLAAPNAQPVKGAGLITGWSKPVTYCNYGWTGNGGCEAKGKWTFCCSSKAGGNFENSKFYTEDAGLGGCYDGGVILCAE
ncbi:uncharacterized protein SEPMUDRAFT_115964 [Sphaerulina musiva SO2202]|uniref:Uncharacterized protein n=1 Tax=Sphaerulina musiva (strain SO2202) TaxID=692275 RepID=M3D9Z1_SPHMS|nr:uncharacterized protein SEPMUDRAFT_115964 [Sphaerulina musiva SO2202]EMF14699.1 hypothetical protein SEPMUDRAFT_115964 [Sphaerulina musiva SO2202]